MRGLPQIIPFAVMLIFLLAVPRPRPGTVHDSTSQAGRRSECSSMSMTTSHVPLWRRLLPVACARRSRSSRHRSSSAACGRASSPRAWRSRSSFLSYTIVTRRGRHDLALPDHVRGRRRRARPPTSRRTTGWPCCVAIPLAALIVVPVGLVAALPSLRVGDLYLALATLAFAGAHREHLLRAPVGEQLRPGCRRCRGRRASATTCPSTTCWSAFFVIVALLVRNVKRVDDRTRARRDAFERTRGGHARHQHRAFEARRVRAQRVRRRPRRRAVRDLQRDGRRRSSSRCSSASCGSRSSSRGACARSPARCSPA